MTSELSAALVNELVGVFSALLDTPVVASPTEERPSGRHWRATLKSDNPAHGAASVCVDEVGATTLAAMIMGLTEAPPEASTQDTLQEALTQAISSTSFKEVTGGVVLRVVTLELVDDDGPGDAAAGTTFEAAGLASPLLVSFGGSLALDGKASANAAASAPGLPATLPPDMPVDRIDVILDIDLPLIVRFGRTELPLKTLARMGPGSLIDLGRSADDPVDVLVSNRVVARGEVVIVGGNYGVRILDVVSPKERIRSMEA
jgi:flagellar motor switch protein FliN/FliY